MHMIDRLEDRQIAKIANLHYQMLDKNSYIALIVSVNRLIDSSNT